jgi:hypothetical protein
MDRLACLGSPTSASPRLGLTGAKTALAAALIAMPASLALPGSPASKADHVDCPALPRGLSPKGGVGSRFTMLLRVNKPDNVTSYLEPGAGDQIRPRDIFLINTRFSGTAPGEEAEMADALHRAYPCNRIISLNGLGSDPNGRGYALSLAESPAVWGLMLDWERRDWRIARDTNPSMSRWKPRFGRNLQRLGSRLAEVTSSLAASPRGPKRTGAIPILLKHWNYGKIARALDAHNRKLGHRRGGIQAVGTQVACQRKGARGVVRNANRLFRQYGRAKRKRRNLALQISFSDTPRKRARLPVASVSPAKAAKCVRAGLRRGAGAFLFWASPEAIHALFSVKRICYLRRPSDGRC